jgi:hypothetical protein
MVDGIAELDIEQTQTLVRLKTQRIKEAEREVEQIREDLRAACVHLTELLVFAGEDAAHAFNCVFGDGDEEDE